MRYLQFDQLTKIFKCFNETNYLLPETHGYVKASVETRQGSMWFL
jgi:hypothetical protein